MAVALANADLTLPKHEGADTIILKFSRFKAATVQAAPVSLDMNAPVDKVCRLIQDAAENGARLVAFSEVFVAGYRPWGWIINSVQGYRGQPIPTLR